jgi:cyclic beta-1,2-glucan synthetase
LKFSRTAFRASLKQLQSRIGVDGLFRDLGDDLPLRSELFSAAQLDAHAESLAGWHQIDPHPGPDRLLARLADNERVLLEAYRLVTIALEQKHRISPAGEWLLDNFYLIEEQIRTARRHLPKRYSHRLPRLLNGPAAGYPLVYDLALELISHVDGRIDAERLRAFVAAYQRRRALTLGELWAIPIMIRQALIENLRRVAARIAKATIARSAARGWAVKMIECAEQSPHQLVLIVADMARPNPPLSSAFVAEMARRLQGQSATFSVALTWMQQRLAEQGHTIEQMVQAEGQQQAVDQVSISNSISGLRELEAIDWRDFVESLSLVEKILREDPAGVYCRMDFQTRDQYRRVVEDAAKHGPLSEEDAGRRAISLARAAALHAGDGHRTAHVGYYLIDGGLPQFRQSTQCRFGWIAGTARLAGKAALTYYLGAIFALAILVTYVVLSATHMQGLAEGIAAALLLVGATQLGSNLVNWATMLVVPPQRLPRLDFSSGISADNATLVAVPTMLVSPQGVEHLLEGLEIRFLANRDDQLRFCLLTDFRDAPQETLAEDAALLQLAQVGVEALNEKYRSGEDDTFYLLHRKRCWNAQEQTWMGHERKRGKLSDLNALLRGGSQAAFALIVGRNPASLSRMKYVITLDTDTLLPRDAARELVGTMAHLLNRARVDAERNIVVEGYGILQPGVVTQSEHHGPSWFARLHAGEVGIDPYTRAISDVYQDLFHEGSFIGKGIYDVDAFVATMEGRFPENQILSHDLLEGCYARAGLVSDIHVYEKYPERYNTDVSRRHRWIRGDWQIAPWLLPRVPCAHGKTEPNPLSQLSRWKLFDNLRRSLVPATLLLTLLLGWCLWPPAWVWTITLMALVVIPAVSPALIAIARAPGDRTFFQHCAQAIQSAGVRCVQAALSLAFLPYEACVSLDAIVRTIGRMLFTRRNMLEWKTASDVERDGASHLLGSVRAMWVAPALAIVTAVALTFWQSPALAAAVPFLALWLCSPAIAWCISRPTRDEAAPLSASQVVYLHQLARNTWRFFEDFVGPNDHWLPPDNYQVEPLGTLAHRTSPTNIGVSLLSNLAANDFGFVSVEGLLDRTARTLQTMQRLERYHGHFLNWYDTQTLSPLYPKYVSTVDSGNLSGHLLTLRAGLLELPARSLLSPGWWGTLDSTRYALRELSAISTVAAEVLAPVLSLLEMSDRVRLRSVGLVAVSKWMRDLASATAALSQTPSESLPALARTWLIDLEQQCLDHHRDLTAIAPWLSPTEHSLEFMTRSPTEPSELRTTLQTLLSQLDCAASLNAIITLVPQLLCVIDELTSDWPVQSAGVLHTEHAGLLELRRQLDLGGQHAVERVETVQQLARLSGDFAELEYDFLYDPSRRLLTIGFNVSERRRDASYYDLLASEARLASFVAIAQGRIKQEHWFALGRLLTTSNRQQMLLSWSGSMFEYLMPLLVMPTHRHTLLDQTYRAVIDRQRQYGRAQGIPWGISESGYNTTDAHLNYQYRAFGVPGLGFKRGLADDLVIAPYATVMALMVEPRAACANLQVMHASGFSGDYGFYEAIDYTRTRLRRHHPHAIVRSYMAHHQGMSLLALAYRLLNRPMQRRFLSDPQFQATELLLQERVPRVASFFPHATEASSVRDHTQELQAQMRVFETPHTPTPEVHLLSNGRYHVMVTNSGGGYSQWKGLAVTRWREDATRDNTGLFCYLRDVDSGEVWSTAHQPTLVVGRRYQAIFSQARAEFRRRDHDIKLHTEIAVSPEDDIEIRRVTLTNRSKVERTIELTSYAEVVLASPAADTAHPAFSNLFVQTEIDAPRHAILCSRRPRSHQERPPWMLHLMAVRTPAQDEPSFETDRAKFLGRRRTTANPDAMQRAGRLSNTAGSVLDPMVSIRQRITLAPDEVVSLDFFTGMADTRDAALLLVDRYRDRHLADRVLDMAWTHGHVLLRQLNASEADAQLYGRLASSIIFVDAARRGSATTLARNQRGQSGLWGHGISGDLPIVLLRIGRIDRLDLVRQLVQAHAYWRLKGLAVDLVIWNDGDNGYRQELQDSIIGMCAAASEAPPFDHPGGVFVRRGDQLSEEDRLLLQAVARVIILDSEGTLEDQLERRVRSELKIPELIPTRTTRPDAVMVPKVAVRPPDLLFFNGLGGFTPDGREYVINMAPGKVSPAPWVNVLANPQFGTVVSEAGSAFTWYGNAHEFRITPWHNDPITDSSGEALYLRDDESGHVWSPMPQPIRSTTPYVCRHGFGYTVFEHTEWGITTELWIYVSIDLPIKFLRLKIRNASGRTRRLSVTGYVEWVLGELRAKSLMHVATEVDATSGALLARNPYSMEFAQPIPFFQVSETTRTVTGDRAEFLGRNGSLAKPAALSRQRLSNRVGAGLDPCGAIQTSFESVDGREREVVFTLGVGRDVGHVRQLVDGSRSLEAAQRQLEGVWHFWSRTLGVVHVETPDPAVNILANGWLLYQTLSCRFWARSGYYQSGGAIGYRDQLQDVAALLYAKPELIRAHLLLCAAHQFQEGDVQHWWHPPFGRGVRTHFTDDFLWLPLVACRYIVGTGDTGVLDEQIPFLEGRPVKPEEDAYYDLPTVSHELETLYAHCVRSITRGLTFGEHGLPLMGGGDWNDGMNLVGEQGKGESVWLAFFLYEVLQRFESVAEARGDIEFARRCATEAATLSANIELHAWDGAWYRRAYFDNGVPLGSAGNAECQIDSLPQSWAVLSGAGDRQRSQQAMHSVDQRLVRRDDGLIQLFDPPFDKSDLDPGYIKGYVPGVRENGGQYTHGAVWAVMAFAKLGDAARAWELFSLINPIRHGSTASRIAVYKVEPYVVAADVYGVAPHTGRGGWTWYTGSASWMYRLIIESLLGLRLETNRLSFSPCLPADWPSFKLHFRYRETTYHITIHQPQPQSAVNPTTLDGVVMTGGSIPLVDDHQDHNVNWYLSAESMPPPSSTDPCGTTADNG